MIALESILELFHQIVDLVNSEINAINANRLIPTAIQIEIPDLDE